MSRVVEIVRAMGREPPVLRIECARCQRRYVTRSTVAKVPTLKGCQVCRPKPQTAKLLGALARGPRMLRALEASLPDVGVRPLLTRLKQDGKVGGDMRGRWWLA